VLFRSSLFSFDEFCAEINLFNLYQLVSKFKVYQVPNGIMWSDFKVNVRIISSQKAILQKLLDILKQLEKKKDPKEVKIIQDLNLEEFPPFHIPEKGFLAFFLSLENRKKKLMRI